MFIGHYSVSLALKKADTSIPMWKLFLAVQFVDILWSLFIFLGIEKAEIDLHTANPLNLYYMPFTHSILGALFWSTLVFVLTLVFSSVKDTKKRKKAAILAISVFSHWILDAIVHIHDLPLWANSHKIGFGLYHSSLGTFLTETILLIVGAFIYYKVVQKNQKSKKSFLFFIVFLIVLCWNSIWGTKPPTTNLTAGALLFFYFLNALIIYVIEKKFLWEPVNRAGKSSLGVNRMTQR
jgi:quinol-cytochrome oxidoreductase complex cytochrome b subunit